MVFAAVRLVLVCFRVDMRRGGECIHNISSRSLSGTLSCSDEAPSALDTIAISEIMGNESKNHAEITVVMNSYDYY